MHLSVYVPDRLWLAAHGAFPGEGASSLARLGIEALIDASNGGAELRPSPGQVARAEGVIRRLAEEAGRWTDLGYRAGLHLAQTIEWWVLEQMAGARWALVEMPALVSWPIIRDDLLAILAPAADSAASLIAGLQSEKPELGRFSAFAGGMRVSLELVSSPAIYRLARL
jgi:hypothetical protein